jgi:putative AlgH/UPF0301 family transcriptional regulator
MIAPMAVTASLLALVLRLPPPHAPHRRAGAPRCSGVEWDSPEQRPQEWAEPHDGPPQPGTVLVANPGSFDHYFMDSLVLILDHDEEKGTSGVLLNHETPWQVEDMTTALQSFVANTVFLGGERGKDTMIMLHNQPQLAGARQVCDGLWIGGVQAANEAVSCGDNSASQFKFFYKTSEWLPRILSQEIAAGQWRVATISPKLLFSQRGHKTLWNKVRDLLPNAEEAQQEGAAAPPAAPPTALESEAAEWRRLATVAEAEAPAAEEASPLEAANAECQSGAAPASDAAEAAAPAPPPPPPPPPAPAPPPPPAPAASEIESLLGFRRFKGAEQWQVRWRGGEESWEVWGCLDTAALREQATQLKEAAP